MLFPLEVQGRLDDKTRAHAAMLIEAVGLKGYERYYPHELSGGMRKRAALIRTLVYDPPVILMDEPFAAVDAQTRMQLQEDLLRLWSLGRKTIVFVTHDIAEAIVLGDRTLVLTRQPTRIAAEHADPDSRGRATSSDFFAAAGLRRTLRAHPRGGPMTTIDPAAPLVDAAAPPVSRKTLVDRRAHRRWRSLLLLGWQWGAETFGSVFFAYPHRRVWRIVEIARNGELLTDVARDAARLGDRASSWAAPPACCCRSCCAARRAGPRRSSPTSWARRASPNTRSRRGSSCGSASAICRSS